MGLQYAPNASRAQLRLVASVAIVSVLAIGTAFGAALDPEKVQVQYSPRDRAAIILWNNVDDPIGYVVGLFWLAALDFSSGLRLVRMQGHSMEPTFHPGQWLLVRRLNWPSPALKDGEVIVFRKDGEVLMKRIAALAGEFPPEDSQVDLWRARITADRRLSRLAGPLAVREDPVPSGQLYVLGDNPPLSDDSRGFGPIPQSAVIGRVLTTWPDASRD
jgi:signal peptidase I